MTKINGSIRHTFTGTGRSPKVWVKDASMSLVITATDAFAISAEISYDEGNTWTEIEEFIADTVKNFEWSGKAALISFNCTSHTSNDVELYFG